MGEVIRKLKNGKFIGWYLRFVDADGVRKQRASGQPSAAEARRCLVEIEAKVARGRLGIPERDKIYQATIAELTTRFLSEYDSPKIKDLTRWRAKMRYHLVAALAVVGEVPVTQFSVEAAERLRNRLMRRYAANTARTQLSALSAALAWASRKGLISSNPMARLPLPRKTVRLEYLSREEAGRLLSTSESIALSGSTRDQMLAVAVALGIYAGLRAGEIFGLRWREVSLSSRLLSISRSFQRATKNGLTRHIPIGAELYEILSAWQPLCPRSTEGLICPSLDGKSWTSPKQAPRDLGRIYQAAALSVPAAPWHCLRHTFASLFMMSGGNILTLRTLMGHSDVSQTQAYAHLAPQFLAAEVERLQIRPLNRPEK
jgi:integrase